MDRKELLMFKAKAQAELNRLEAQSTAKDVAGKAIGKQLDLQECQIMFVVVLLAEPERQIQILLTMSLLHPQEMLLTLVTY